MASYSVNPEIDSSVEPSPVHLDVSGTQVSFIKYPATSWSDANAVFTIIPPSVDTFVNRAIRSKYHIRVTYSGTSGGAMLLNGADALKSLADLRMKTVENVAFNGSTYPVSNYWSVIPDLAEHFDPVIRKEHSLGAPDTYQTYADGVGSINNALSTYPTSESAQQKRGALSVLSITNGSTSAVVEYELNSWIYIPDLLGVSVENDLGLVRLKTLTITTTFDMSASRIVAHAANVGITINSCVVTHVTAPELTCKFISVPRDLLPRGPLRYRHRRIEAFVTSYGTSVAANTVSSSPLISNNVQLSRVPRFLFCWVRESDSNKTINSSDTFCAVQQGFSINFNNQSGLLSSASVQDLWNMSRQVGLLDSWNEFSGLALGSSLVNVGTIGSVVALEFGKHISLGGGQLSINSPGAFNFSVNFPFKNVNQNSAINNPTLYVVACFDHDMIVSEGGDIQFEHPSSPVGLVASGDNQPVKLVYEGQFARGAGFMDWIRKINDFLKRTKLISGVSSVLSAVPQLAPVAAPVSAISRSLGYGSGEGGNVLSKKELKDRIRKL